MAKRKKYKVETLRIRTGRWGGQIITFDKKSFGWRDEGYETGSEVTGIDYDSGKIQKKAFKEMTFTRPDPYTDNFLFKFVELLSKIVGFFRRIALSLAPIVVIGLIIALALGVFGDDPAATGNVILTVIGIYVGLIGGSFLLDILGRIMKKSFKIEEKLEAAMTEAGYEYDD